jgi:hypothetical protein
MLSSSQHVNLSQSTVALGLVPPALRLEKLCCNTIAKLLFSEEHEQMKLGNLSCLYRLPDSSVELLVDSLRGCVTDAETSDEAFTAIGEYVHQVLRCADDASVEVTPPAKRFADIRSHNKKDVRYPAGSLALDVQLRNFALAEYLTLSRAESFDTVFLAVVGYWRGQLPVPPALPRLRSLVVRGGLYEVSHELLRAASELECLVIESDEFVRDNDLLLAGIGASKVRRLVFRDMQGGDSDSKVTQAVQQLKNASRLEEVAFEHCDGIQLGAIVGFLAKRVESLRTVTVCSSRALPQSIASTIASSASITRVSLRQCAALNEAHLTALVAGCTHIRHLDLTESAVDSRKLFKLAERLAKEVASGTPVVLDTLDLSRLTLNLSSVLAVMKSTPSLRTLLLERTEVTLKTDDDVERAVALKRMAKNKRIGGGKKGGGGAKSKPKPKKAQDKGKGKEEEEGGEGAEKKEETKEEKGKEKKKTEPMDLSKLRTGVTRLLLGQCRINDWCMAQIIVHCPDLEHLDISGSEDNYESSIPIKTRTRFNAVMGGHDNPLGLDCKAMGVVTTAVLTRHKLRSLNCLLTGEGGVLPWPVLKGGVKPGAQTWPLMETLLMPHPRKFIFAQCRPQNITTMVVSTTSKISCLQYMSNLRVVVLVGICWEYTLPYETYRSVPHLVLDQCTLSITDYCDSIGYSLPPPVPEGQEPPERVVSADRLRWSAPDWKLKRVSLYRCAMTNMLDDNEKTRFEPALLKRFDDTKALFPEEVMMPSHHRRYFFLGAQTVHFLRTCVTEVTHSLITQHRDFLALLPTEPEHPNKGRMEHPPDWVWPYGTVMNTAKYGPGYHYDTCLQWGGDE